jgi:hypothetical protein
MSPPTLLELDLARYRKVSGLFFPLLFPVDGDYAAVTYQGRLRSSAYNRRMNLRLSTLQPPDMLWEQVLSDQAGPTNHRAPSEPLPDDDPLPDTDPTPEEDPVPNPNPVARNFPFGMLTCREPISRPLH